MQNKIILLLKPMETLLILTIAIFLAHLFCLECNKEDWKEREK